MSDSIPLDVYQRHILRVSNSQSYFKFFREYTLIMGKIEALFLQDLINRNYMIVSSTKNRRSPQHDDDGFFMCTEKFLTNKKYSLVWSRHEQETLLRKLVKAGFIETKKKGVPPKRWIKIDLSRIHGDLDKVKNEETLETLGGVPQSPGGPGDLMTRTSGSSFIRKEQMNYNKLSISRNSVADAPSPSGNSTVFVINTSDRESFFGETNNESSATDNTNRAKLLRESLRHKKIPVTNMNPIKSWSKEFRILERSVSGTEIDEVLKWYASKIGDKYIPVAHCGKSFRLKFSKIKDAMIKDRKVNPVYELSKDMEPLVAELLRYRWPKGSEQWVELGVAYGHYEFKKFRNHILQFLDYDKTHPFRKFCENAVIPSVGSAEAFLKRWMMDLLKELSKWEQWNGSKMDFLNRCFHMDSTNFLHWGVRLAMKYSNKPDLWYKITEGLRCE